MVSTDCFSQLTLFPIDQQEVTVDFQGGQVVSDAGLLSLRTFEKKLGIISGLAERFADPRDQEMITFSTEQLLTQRIFQILADYPDANDAQTLRHDPLFQTISDRSPSSDDPTLASGSTLNRFHYAFTRRESHLPLEERPVLLERQAALNQRVEVTNNYLVDVFVRTRTRPPSYVIIDLDASDDPTHGEQYLSLFHGYYDQYQYFPLFAFDGETGFPLAAWLRHGTAHASLGAVDVLQEIVERLRQAWPNLTILVRGDAGFAMPEMYEYCEAQGLFYAFGFSSNETLKRRTDDALQALSLSHGFYCPDAPSLQRFETIEDYQAGSWSRSRRILVKLEITKRGTNRRFVVTNMSGHPQGLYHGFYVQRGNVPERPICELKNDLHADRLSQSGFRANALRLLEHTLAYAICVLYREAAAAVPEVARAEVGTLRKLLWKVGAVVQTSVRRIWFHFSATWLYRELWLRVHAEVMQHAERLQVQRILMPTATPILLK